MSTFPGWSTETDENGSEREVKPFPSSLVSQSALALMGLASFLIIVSMIWQHTASVASATTLQDMTYGTVRAKVGVVAMALGWAGLALIIVPSLGLLVMVISIRILDRLVD